MFLKFLFEGKSGRRLNTVHTTGPTDAREHFPEEMLTPGKNMFLEVDSLVGN